jgi:thymidylate synthase
MLAANNWNVCQYAILLHMFAQVSGLEAGTLLHVIADAHIYDRHIPAVERMLENPRFDAPTLKINPEVPDFYAFTRDDFNLEGYKYADFSGEIEVAL